MAAVADQTTSGGMGRFSIFAIWVMPLLTALVLVEIFRLVTGRPRPGQPVGAVETIAVGLIAIVMTVLDAQNIADGLRNGRLVAADGDRFLWLTTITFVGMMALTVILCFQIRMPGFRNAFWLLWSVPLLAGIPEQIGWQFDLFRTGAAAANHWLIFCGAHVVFIVAVIVIAALWRSACIPSVETRNASIGVPLEILIWPVFLATLLAPLAKSVLVFAMFNILPALSDPIGWELTGLWIFIAELNLGYSNAIQIVLSALFIPFLVCAYIRHNRSVIRPDAPVALIGIAIALVQIAVLTLPELMAWNWGFMSVGGTGILAITLTILGLAKTFPLFARNREPAEA
ncbi:hypothetical protein ACRQ1B_24875 [Rhizobium panacihumi]|uniref:hypothetical protein n=1 Tax=Rhizobium panacihumi TaxID=2008450 RepID=UPI003D79F77A